MNKDFGKIIYYENKYWLVESAEHYEPDSSWFAVPIYEVEDKIETRNAGAGWLFKAKGAFLVLDYPVEKYKKVLQSQVDYYKWCFKISAEEYKIRSVYKRKIKFLHNLYVKYMFNLSIGDKVKVVGGNNEFGQPTMMNCIGVITSFGTKYKVKDKDTVEVYVRFPDQLFPETHAFNDYHLKKRKVKKSI